VISEWLLDHVLRDAQGDPTLEPEVSRCARWAVDRFGLGRRTPVQAPSDLVWLRDDAFALWSRSRFADRLPEAIAYADAQEPPGARAGAEWRRP
jgi:hypothetical protein